MMVGGGGGGGGGAAPGGGRAGEQLYHHPGDLAAGTAAGPPYLGGGSSSSAHSTQGRMYGGGASWAGDPLASARHHQGRRAAAAAAGAAAAQPPASAALPFPMPMGWYPPGAHDAAEVGGGGLEDYRQVSHHLEHPMGYPSAMTDPFQHRPRQQHRASLSRAEWPVSSMEGEGAGERAAAGMDPQRRRTWEPAPGNWPGHSDPLLRSPQAGMGSARSNRMPLVSLFGSCQRES